MFDEKGERYLDCINNVAHGKQFNLEDYLYSFISDRDQNTLLHRASLNLLVWFNNCLLASNS